MLPAGGLALLPVPAGGSAARLTGRCPNSTPRVLRDAPAPLLRGRRRLVRVVVPGADPATVHDTPARPVLLRVGALGLLPVPGSGSGAGVAGWCRTVLRVVGRGTDPVARLPGGRRLARVVARARIRPRFTTVPVRPGVLRAGMLPAGALGLLPVLVERLGGGRGGLVPNSAPRGGPGDAPGPAAARPAPSRTGRGSGADPATIHDSPGTSGGASGWGCFRRALWVFCRFWSEARGRAWRAGAEQCSAWCAGGRAWPCGCPAGAVSHGSWLGRRSGHDSRQSRYVRGCFGWGCFRRALWVFCRFWSEARGRAWRAGAEQCSAWWAEGRARPWPAHA